ncbi:hypothetical protein [uncultured Sphingomonas sp.]|uniref:hypothetical protein n=1 Tax=uncultured Sphingomonas sp. TaxID=158754 RepID=UPI0025F93190|nr:hypothetical protein [uncultured Sphingomonas sp.]
MWRDGEETEEVDTATAAIETSGLMNAGGATARAARLPAFTQAHPLASWSPSRRPPRHPVMRVPRRHVGADHLNGGKDPAAWVLIGIEAADDLGIVRTGMTYDKEYGTSAGFFEKPQRLQFFEGPNEPAVADHLEMSPRYLDFQFQPLRLTFRRADGRVIHKYPDVGIEYDDHSVRFGEIKSDDSWFQAEGIRRPLERIDMAMSASGMDTLLRIKGTAFRRDEVLKAHGLAMEARLTSFDPSVDGLAARAAIMAEGGRARYADVVAALGGHRAHAVDKLYAMLMRRVVDFDLSWEPTDDTVVTAPRPATAFALRELLARFQRQAA